MRLRIEEKCPQCEYVGSNGAFLVRGPIHRNFQIGFDRGVIEVGDTLMTIPQQESMRDLFQSAIWESAAAAGLLPHEYQGQGHVNIDVKTAFGDDALGFRNFLMDLANHPELGAGILDAHENMPVNALPVSQWSRDRRKNFFKQIERFGRKQSLVTSSCSRSSSRAASRRFAR
jgi:hypothetical protein